MSSEHVDKIADVLKASGLRCDVVGSTLGNWATSIKTDFAREMKRADTLFHHMQILDAKYARIMSYPNDGLDDNDWQREVFQRISLLCRKAEDEGVILLHENCAGWAGQSAQNTLALLEAVKSPALKLLFDIGNGIAYGYDSVAFLKQIIEYVAHVHIKDAVRSGTDVTYCLPGHGESKVDVCLQLLSQASYNGIYAIEPHLQFIPHLKKDTDSDSMSKSYVQYARIAEEMVINTYG
jgi:sugar phosphate isomerase/epimerase